MERGSVFTNNKMQAIRLPKSMQLPRGTKTVDILKQGRAWVIVPSDQSWSQWFEDAQVSPDFMEAREQPADQQRSAL
jgi:antitoxin VapB